MRKSGALFGALLGTAVSLLGCPSRAPGPLEPTPDSAEVRRPRPDSDDERRPKPPLGIVRPAAFKVPASGAPWRGARDAKVTIVEFSDFQCPFCARVVPTLDRLLGEFQSVKLVFKHNPLPFHADAPLAARASWAAWQQGKFWEMHDKLFENMRALGGADIERYAREVGLDVARFRADVDSVAADEAVKAQMAEAARFGARGTPSFFINGRKLVGAQPFEKFAEQVRAAMEEADLLVGNGVPLARVYEEITGSGKERAEPEPPRRYGVPDSAAPGAVVQVPVGDAPTRGPANAPVTIVVFSDFQCPFCARLGPTLDRVEREYGNKVRIAFKQFPLAFHADAPLAAEASLAAHEQGKFWEMHDRLFSNTRTLQRDKLEEYAKEIGLDVRRFVEALDSGRFKERVETDKRLGERTGVSGTPCSFVNGRKVSGALPFEELKRVIDEELKKKGI